MEEPIARNPELMFEIKRHWDRLLEHGQILHFQPGQYVFYENHQALGAYLLCQGSIALVRSSDPQFLKTLSAESQPIIGMDYLLTGSPNDFSAKALTEAQICYLPKSEVLSLLPHGGGKPIH